MPRTIGRRGCDAGQQQHSDDAGCAWAHWTVAVKTGHSPRQGGIPKGSVGLVSARSSPHLRGLSLANGVGVIDSGYRGEVLLAVRNDVNVPVTINEGERIAQIVVVPLDLSSALYARDARDAQQHNNSNNEPRGTGGFGSTGRN